MVVALGGVVDSSMDGSSNRAMDDSSDRPLVTGQATV